jgi:hypothetical protein
MGTKSWHLIGVRGDLFICGIDVVLAVASVSIVGRKMKTAMCSFYYYYQSGTVTWVLVVG